MPEPSLTSGTSTVPASGPNSAVSTRVRTSTTLPFGLPTCLISIEVSVAVIAAFEYADSNSVSLSRRLEFGSSIEYMSA